MEAEVMAMWGLGAQVQVACGSWKGRNRLSPAECPEGTQPCQHLDVSEADFGLQASRTIK